MDITTHSKTAAQKIFRFAQRHSLSILGVFFLSILFLPFEGFCDINSAFTESKSQVEMIVSNKSGFFWILMVIVLGGGITMLYKGNWKGVGIALIIGILLGNFSDVIDSVLSTKIFKGKSQTEQPGNN